MASNNTPTPSSAAAMPVVTDELRRDFKSFDTNGDGKISASELGNGDNRRVSKSFACKISVSELGDGGYRCVFKLVDTNGDGKISVSELGDGDYRRVSKSVDTNGDGKFGDILKASSPSREMPLPHLRTQPPSIQIVVNPPEPALPPPPPPPPPTPTSTHAIFAFIVATFVSFVPIKFPEARTSSPFETHPTTIIVFFASLISYCSSFWASKRFPIHAYVFHVTMRSAALLALASLLSLLSGSFYRVPYMMLIFYFIGECFQLLPMPWQLACRQAIHRSVSDIPHGPTSAV